MSDPLLTRVVTVYRQWDFVARWIFQDELFESGIAWILINDAPDAPIPPELRQAAEARSIRMVENRFNQGRSWSRNLGSSLAASRWVEHVDGDDLPLPVDLGELRRLEEGTLPDLVLYPTLAHDDRFVAGNLGPGWPEGRPDIEPIHQLFAAWKPVDWRPAGLLWRREALLGLGGYDARFEGAEDAHLVWKASCAGCRIAHAARAKQSIYTFGERAEQIYLTMGRLRFWEAVAERRDGNPLAEGVRAVQLKVLFWSVRAALLRGLPRRVVLWEALKLGLVALREGK